MFRSSAGEQPVRRREVSLIVVVKYLIDLIFLFRLVDIMLEFLRIYLFT